MLFCVIVLLCGSQEGAVVALLKRCRQDCFSSLYAHALRTVASICCVEEGITQLEKVQLHHIIQQLSLKSP